MRRLVSLSVLALFLLVVSTLSLAHPPEPLDPEVSPQVASYAIKSTIVTNDVRGRTLARTSAGRLWTVYLKTTGVFAAYSDNGGATWTEEQVAAMAGQESVAIAIDSADSLHVVWCGLGWGANPSIENIEYRKRTTSWQAQEAITDKNRNQGWPSIAIDSADNAHVVWDGWGWGANVDDANIEYRKRTTSWQTQEAVTDKNAQQTYPVLAIDSADNVHVVWRGLGWGTNTGSYNIEYRKRTTSWQAQEAVTDKNGEQGRQTLAIDSADNVHVTWAGFGWGTYPDQCGIQYRKRTTSWQAQEAVTDKNATQGSPSIAIDSADNVHVVWRGLGWGTNTGSYNIEYRKRTTSWQTQAGLTDSATAQQRPRLAWALHPTGTASSITGYAFTWENGTTHSIYLSADLLWYDDPSILTATTDIPTSGETVVRSALVFYTSAVKGAGCTDTVWFPRLQGRLASTGAWGDPAFDVNGKTSQAGWEYYTAPAWAALPAGGAPVASQCRYTPPDPTVFHTKRYWWRAAAYDTAEIAGWGGWSDAIQVRVILDVAQNFGVEIETVGVTTRVKHLRVTLCKNGELGSMTFDLRCYLAGETCPADKDEVDVTIRDAAGNLAQWNGWVEGKPSLAEPGYRHVHCALHDSKLAYRLAVADIASQDLGQSLHDLIDLHCPELDTAGIDVTLGVSRPLKCLGRYVNDIFREVCQEASADFWVDSAVSPPRVNVKKWADYGAAKYALLYGELA